MMKIYPMHLKKQPLKYPWINKYKDKSVSELEIIYGALNTELSKTNKNDKNKTRKLFFFRDPLSITKRFELGDPERNNYEESSSDGHRKLRELENSPIFPITPDNMNYDILPPLLQLFSKEKRSNITFTPENMNLLKYLSLLLMKSGGHPRRVLALLTYLNFIQFGKNTLQRVQNIQAESRMDNV